MGSCGVIIEYDGIQHFDLNPFFHKNDVDSFRNRKYYDILKHLVIISSKYRYKIIRIDYTASSEEKVREHILAKFATINFSYYSNPLMYSWIIAAEQEFFSKVTGMTWEQEMSLIQEMAMKYSA